MRALSLAALFCLVACQSVSPATREQVAIKHAPQTQPARCEHLGTDWAQSLWFPCTQYDDAVLAL